VRGVRSQFGVVPLGRDLQEVLDRAGRLAAQRGQDAGSAHVLLALASGEGPSALPGRILAERGISETVLRGALRAHAADRPGAVEALAGRAARIARDCGAPHAGPLHMLLAMTREPGTAAALCLADVGCDVSVLRGAVMGALVARRPALPQRLSASTRRAPAPAPVPQARPVRDPRDPLPIVRRPTVAPRRPTAPARGRPVPQRVLQRATSPTDIDAKRFPLLSTLGRDLTAAAARGDLDPLVGREAALDGVLDVLHRRNGACPCLVGAAGVGKTAIVHGLARRMAAGDAGDALRPIRLVEIQTADLLAGTGTRGALSERLAGLRREIARAGGRILLFLDDLHAILGPDAAAEAGAELRSALSKGELWCVSAMSISEWKRTMESDPALERRFSRVDVDEMSEVDALAVTRGVAPRYAAHHGMPIEDGAVDAAVRMSVRWIPGRALPEKAIATLDLAAARARRRGASVVDAAAVASVVATLSGAPEERVAGSDGAVLAELESRLAERVVGHGDALHRISSAIRRNAAGFRRRRPIGSFLLLGPTGVGKTETARALAEVLFPEGGATTRLDLGEYAEPHSLARLVGAPPGYVGHEEGGQLTESVRRRPYQVLLLDEIEKAHPQVLTALLGLLEDGRMTDGRGRTVDFTNVVVVMTSNLGADARASAGVGFGSESAMQAKAGEATIAAARRALPPELWNRLDETIAYAPLDRSEVAEIAHRMLRAVARAVFDEHGIVFTYDIAAPAALADAGGYDPSMGARPMRRTIQRLVEEPLAIEILSGRLSRGASVRLCADLQISPR